jgi:nitrate/nitrite transporter NarK
MNNKPGATHVVFLSTTAYFPKQTAIVTGLSASFGGLGLLRDATGAYTWGFIFLGLFALFCLSVNYFVFLRQSCPTTAAAITV